LSISPEIGASETRIAKEVFPLFDRNADGVLSLFEFMKAFPMSGSTSKSTTIKQAHLSMGGDASYWVMWVTDAVLEGPFVRWGLSGNALTHSATGTRHTYNVGLFGWHKQIYQCVSVCLRFFSSLRCFLNRFTFRKWTPLHQTQRTTTNSATTTLPSVQYNHSTHPVHL
jgi:hypothetical protein